MSSIYAKPDGKVELQNLLDPKQSNKSTTTYCPIHFSNNRMQKPKKSPDKPPLLKLDKSLVAVAVDRILVHVPNPVIALATCLNLAWFELVVPPVLGPK
jgi:hypothetical protein